MLVDQDNPVKADRRGGAPGFHGKGSAVKVEAWGQLGLVFGVIGLLLGAVGLTLGAVGLMRGVAVLRRMKVLSAHE